MEAINSRDRALQLLQTYFGYTSFRPAQEAPVESLLKNEDVVAIMPTGAGKSICFQIPDLNNFDERPSRWVGGSKYTSCLDQ